MIEIKEISFSEMSSTKIIEKTSLILKTMVANKQDWSIETLLDIIHDILTQFNDVVKIREGEISKLIEEVFNNFDTCVSLLSHYQMPVVEKTS